MNTRLSFCLVVLLGTLGIRPARADLEVSASVTVHSAADFEAPLAADGSWVAVGGYGRCWRPAGVAVEWRPYCYGEWVWTDCGWYWASDEPWGWACYHYGCWVYDPAYAWVWVPGVEWAPAWVSWRVGGGYIGWAPLPPPGFAVRAGEPQFVFVGTAHFADRVRPNTVIVNNTTILNRTTVINNVKRETRNIGGPTPQRVVINEGPGLATVQTATAKTLRAVPIREAARQALPPSGFVRAQETRNQGKSPPSQNDRFRSPQESKALPSENQEGRGRSAPFSSYRDSRNPHGNLPPDHPPAGSPPRGKSDRAPEAQGGGGDHEHHGEGHGKDKP